MDVVPQTIEDNLSDVLETLVVSEQVDLLGKEAVCLLEPSDVRVDESSIVMGFGADISVRLLVNVSILPMATTRRQ